MVAIYAECRHIWMKVRGITNVYPYVSWTEECRLCGQQRPLAARKGEGV